MLPTRSLLSVLQGCQCQMYGVKLSPMLVDCFAWGGLEEDAA